MRDQGTHGAAIGASHTTRRIEETTTPLQESLQSTAGYMAAPKHIIFLQAPT